MARLPPNAYLPNLDNFLDQCHRRKYPARSTMIYAGDASDTLYFIIAGSVSVVIEDDEGREMVVAYLNAGDFFGEMGLFEDRPVRSAWTARSTKCSASAAVGPSNLATLTISSRAGSVGFAFR